MSGGRRPVGPTDPPGLTSPDPDVPVFVISVAAELTGLHPQTLRTYDRLGLVKPGRTGGGGRRYSWRDIELLREVAELTSAGIGLEGVRRILELEVHVDALRRRVAELQQELAATDYALHQALSPPAQQPAPAQPSAQSSGRPGRRNLPAVRATTSAGQSVTVWRRGRS